MAVTRRLFLQGVVLNFVAAQVNEQNGFRQETIIVSPGTLTMEYLRPLAGSLADRRDVLVGCIRVFTSEDDASSATRWKGADFGYPRWRRSFEDSFKVLKPSASILVINGAASILLRDAAVKIVQATVGSTDPRRIDTPGGIARIIHVSLPFPPLPVNPGYRTVEFYIVTSRPINETIARDCHVSVRNDAWFIADENFPIFYRYQESLQPPSLEQLMQTKTASCSDDGRSCYAGRPLL